MTWSWIVSVEVRSVSSRRVRKEKELVDLTRFLREKRCSL